MTIVYLGRFVVGDADSDVTVHIVNADGSDYDLTGADTLELVVIQTSRPPFTIAGDADDPTSGEIVFAQVARHFGLYAPAIGETAGFDLRVRWVSPGESLPSYDPRRFHIELENIEAALIAAPVASTLPTWVNRAKQARMRERWFSVNTSTRRPDYGTYSTTATMTTQGGSFVVDTLAGANRLMEAYEFVHEGPFTNGGGDDGFFSRNNYVEAIFSNTSFISAAGESTRGIELGSPRVATPRLASAPTDSGYLSFVYFYVDATLLKLRLAVYADDGNGNVPVLVDCDLQPSPLLSPSATDGRWAINYEVGERIECFLNGVRMHVYTDAAMLALLEANGAGPDAGAGFCFTSGSAALGRANGRVNKLFALTEIS